MVQIGASHASGEVHDRSRAADRCGRGTRRLRRRPGCDRRAARRHRHARSRRAVGRAGARRRGRRPRRRGDRARRGAADRTDPAAARRLLRGQELPRARGGVRPLRLRPARPLGGAARAPDHLHQGDDVARRPVRRHRGPPRRHQRAGLRGRARRDHRPRRARDLPRGRVRPRLGLHDRRRRDRARSPAAAQAVDDREVAGHALPARPVRRERRRGPRRHRAASSSHASTASCGSPRRSRT